MTQITKYILGACIIGLLVVTPIYYKNSQTQENVGYGTQNQIKEENVNDTVLKTPGVEENRNKNNVSSMSKKEISQSDLLKINQLITKYYNVTNELDSKILLSNKQEEIEKRKEIFSRKKDIIGGYSNLKNYIKYGLKDNTYVVFTTYDIKIRNIDPIVPGMSVLTVVKDESTGDLLVNVSPNKSDLNDYIRELAELEDMKKIIEKVNAELAETIKKDASLKEFVDYLKEIT